MVHFLQLRQFAPCNGFEIAGAPANNARIDLEQKERAGCLGTVQVGFLVRSGDFVVLCLCDSHTLPIALLVNTYQPFGAIVTYSLARYTFKSDNPLGVKLSLEKQNTLKSERRLFPR